MFSSSEHRIGEKVMTKRELMAQYGIVRLMPDSEADRELSAEEEKLFERNLRMSQKSFEQYWNGEFLDVTD